MNGSLRSFVIVGLLLSSVMAASSAWLADDAPDGLSKVARNEGFADRQADHVLEDSPIAGYRIERIDDEGMGTAMAGLLGVLLTFSLAAVAVGAVRLRRKRTITTGDGP